MSIEREEPKNSKFFTDNEWLIRRSTIYEGEYKECTSIRGRLNQYFIFGELLDCSQWKRDFNNSGKWEESKDMKAAIEVIDSEKARRKKRLGAHMSNDVWEKRTAPPENWDVPLPEYILKSYEYSYLDIKAKELRGEIPRSSDMTFTSTCTIL